MSEVENNKGLTLVERIEQLEKDELQMRIKKKHNRKGGVNE